MHIPNEYVMLGSLFMLVAVLPLSLALARRLWKRGAAPVATLPAELIERLHRMESSVESTALEVERIGEGQRFLTRLMSDHLSALGEGSPRGGFLERAKERASHSGTTPH